MSDLKAEARKLVLDFNGLDIYQRYLQIKAIYLASPVYKRLNELDKLKKDAKLIEYSKRAEYLSQIKAEIDGLHTDSLFINYQAIKSEVDELLEPLKTLKL